MAIQHPRVHTANFEIDTVRRAVLGAKQSTVVKGRTTVRRWWDGRNELSFARDKLVKTGQNEIDTHQRRRTSWEEEEKEDVIK